MIIIEDHNHPQQSNLQNTRKRKIVFDADRETRLILENLLANSQKKFDNDVQTRLRTMRKNREDRAYANLDYSASDYLLILLKERNEKIENDALLIQEILNKKQKGVIKDLKFNKLSINRSLKPLTLIKKELQESLEVMRIKNPEKHLSPSYNEEQRRRQALKHEHYLQFRRHSYWKVPNQQHQETLKLISSIKREQKELRQRSLQAQYRRKNKKLLEQKQLITQRQQRLKEQRQKVHQHYKQHKQARQMQLKQQEQKQRKIQQYLSKYKTKAPAFIVFEQNDKKMKELQQNRINSILQQVRQKKRRYRLSDIHESIIEYQQIRQKRAQQFQEKRILDLKSQQQIKQRLSLLYKPKIRSSSALQAKIPDQKQKRQQKLIKMKIYNERVKQQHSPQVDEQMRQSLVESINQIKKKQHKIQKKKDGSLILIDKEQLNPREIGLQYLEEVKRITSLIERKPPIPPAPQQFKLVDKSLTKKQPKTKRVTISNWKDIIDDDRLTQVQKQQKLRIYFELIEQQSMKVNQQRKSLSVSKSIDLQKKMDHYQLEKAAAKLSLLKSMI